MSTWIRESQKSWCHKICTKILKSGPIPKHVAFIMDGNRRFAKKRCMDRSQGHLMGFDKLAETLDWCLELGVSEVTVYAFSIENFKRSKEEVDGLMELAKQKFSKLMQEKELIEKHGVCFRVLGNLSLLPKDIQEIIVEAVTTTQHNNKAILNVCFSYTSRDEICTAMRDIAEGVQLGLIKDSDINERLIEDCLYTHKSEAPDLLIRTSGEVRLSDFLLWQSVFSVLSFIQVLWPEFSVWHLYAGIIHYQRNHAAVQAAKQDNMKLQEKSQREQDYLHVVQNSQSVRNGTSQQNGCSMHERVSKYAADREQRCKTFLHHVHSKREQFYLNILNQRQKIEL